MDVLFLDANILFCAAYRPDAGLRRLWRLPEVRMITSVYAAEEARRNLSHPRQQEDLEELLDSVEVVSNAAPMTRCLLISTINVPDKDLPLPGNYLSSRTR